MSYPLGEVYLILSLMQRWITSECTWIARLILKYVIHTDTGTYAHSDSKSCGKNDRTGIRQGLESHHHTM